MANDLASLKRPRTQHAAPNRVSLNSFVVCDSNCFPKYSNILPNWKLSHCLWERSKWVDRPRKMPVDDYAL